MAREGNVIPFTPRTPSERPDPLIDAALRRAFPEELFAHPHDPWFVEQILERIQSERSS